MSLLQTTLDRIRPLDEEAMAQARARQDTLTKPQGSLGRLEDLTATAADERWCSRSNWVCSGRKSSVEWNHLAPCVVGGSS